MLESNIFYLNVTEKGGAEVGYFIAEVLCAGIQYFLPQRDRKRWSFSFIFTLLWSCIAL